jgi:hypothetical protein
LKEKETKSSSKNDALRRFSRPTHMKSLKNWKFISTSKWKVHDSASCYAKELKALFFRLFFLKNREFYCKRKKGAGNVFDVHVNIWLPYPLRYKNKRVEFVLLKSQYYCS